MEIAFALSAAFFFALAPVLQQEVAAHAPARLALSPKVIGFLVRRPLWLLGIVAILVGSVFQALALHDAALTRAEPLLATNVLFAVGLTSLRDRKAPRPRDWVGSVAVCAGIAGLLISLRPQQGRAVASNSVWLAVGVAVAVFIALSFAFARRTESVTRAALLGSATGAALGMQDAMNHGATSLISTSGWGALLNWQPWGVLVIGAGAFTLQQMAHRAGSVPGSQPALMVTQTIIAMLFGAIALGEHIEGSPVRLAIGAVCLLAAVGGIIVLTHSPLAERTTTLEAEEERKRHHEEHLRQHQHA